LAGPLERRKTSDLLRERDVLLVSRAGIVQLHWAGVRRLPRIDLLRGSDAWRRCDAAGGRESPFTTNCVE